MADEPRASMPPELVALLDAIRDAHLELTAIGFSAGNYLAHERLGRRHHEGLRRAAQNLVAASRVVVTRTEGVIRLGKDAEKAQRRGYSISEEAPE